MTLVAEPEPVVLWLGLGVGTELWGLTAGNFAYREPTGRTREVAVQVNDAAMEYLAAQLGRDDTPEFREEVLRVVGAAILQSMLARESHVPPEVMVSSWVLSQQPELVELARQLLGPPKPAVAA